VQERVAAVFGAVFGLFGRVLPTHVGWAVIPLAVVGGIAVTRGRARDRHGAAWLGLCALGTLALLASTATVSSYEWEHNLYWKWLTPSVPFLLLFGAHGGIGLVRRLGLRAGSAVAVGLIVATLLGYAGETRRQVDLSEQQYGTQVRLAQWLEESWDPRIGVVCDAIPAAWLRRRPSSIRIFDWTGPELPHDDPDAFGRWLLAQRIGLVMWYREEWVGAIDAAAYLADGNGRQLGPVRLDRIAREDGYGLIAFQVSGPGLASPRTPPPADLPGGAQ